MRSVNRQLVRVMLSTFSKRKPGVYLGPDTSSYLTTLLNMVLLMLTFRSLSKEVFSVVSLEKVQLLINKESNTL